MKYRKLFTLICICCLLLINVNITQAAEVTQDKAVVSVTLADSTVHYYDSIDDAIAIASANENSTLKLLANIETNGITINSGKFTIDLNGYTLSCDKTSAKTLIVNGGEVCFTDSSSEKTGTISGTAFAIYSSAADKVKIESGNYQADTWAIYSGGEALNISGGYFKGSIPVQVSSGQATISGGEFEGGQCALYNDGTTTVTDGTFVGGIQNFTTGILYFQGGSVVITGENGYNTGIDNGEELYLSGGTFYVKDGVDIASIGVLNNDNGASLYLSGDVTFQNIDTDFDLAGDMYVSGAISNCYSIKTAVPTDDADAIFARGSGSLIYKDNFVSVVPGYRVTAAEDNTYLYLSVCNHEVMDDQSVCQECGISIEAKIGDKYYETLDDAFAAVTGTNQVIELVADVDGATIPGGTFTLNFNGHTIDSLSADGGKVILKGTGADGEYIERLNIGEGDDVELQGITVKGNDPIANSGKLTITSGKLLGGEVGIINYGGTVDLVGGEITTDQIGVINLGGNLSVGKNGTGPVIKAPIGIVNGKPGVGVQLPEPVLNMDGGKIIAETDIYNKTGDFTIDDNSSPMPLIAGTVQLKGGTFEGGIKAQLDEGEDLADILGEDHGYYGSEEKALTVEAGAALIDQTVTVKALTENSTTEDNSTSDQDTSAGTTEDGTTEGNSTTEEKTEAGAGTTENATTEANSTTEQKTEAGVGATENNNTSDQAVETGDSINIGVLLATMFISGIILIRMKRMKI